jgi:hypothetical protein
MHVSGMSVGFSAITDQQGTQLSTLIWHQEDALRLNLHVTGVL